MLVPHSWQKTNWKLQAAIVSSISAGDFWARARNLKFLKFVHRLDAETTGILLFAKSQGAVDGISDLFKTRKMEKTYLAVVAGAPPQDEWTCRQELGPPPAKLRRRSAPAGHDGAQAALGDGEHLRTAAAQGRAEVGRLAHLYRGVRGVAQGETGDGALSHRADAAVRVVFSRG